MTYYFWLGEDAEVVHFNEWVKGKRPPCSDKGDIEPTTKR